jgi:hypothetical protein
MPSKRPDLHTLKRLLKELERILKMEPLPRGISERSQELLESIAALTDDLIERAPAAVLGQLGGKTTAKRGSEYYAKIADLRKTRAGGRPQKTELTLRSDGQN